LKHYFLEVVPSSYLQDDSLGEEYLNSRISETVIMALRYALNSATAQVFWRRMSGLGEYGNKIGLNQLFTEIL
jgi:hypothetical protein